MKIALIVEGQSDKIVFESQGDWFSQLGFEVTVRRTRGKPEMCKKARKFHRAETILGSQKAIFLPDQHGDPCATYTREKVGMNDCPCAITVVLKRELEAWILADGKAVTKATGKQYQPAGQTDSVRDPKQELTARFSRAFGYNPSEVEMASEISQYFSLARAAKYNTSAKRFVDELSALARGQSP